MWVSCLKNEYKCSGLSGLLSECFLTWPLRQRWFWMLFFLLLLVLIIPFLVVGLLLNFSPGTIAVLLMILAVIWIINKSYTDWKRKQEEQLEMVETTSLQKDTPHAIYGAAISARAIPKSRARAPTNQPTWTTDGLLQRPRMTTTTTTDRQRTTDGR